MNVDRNELLLKIKAQRGVDFLEKALKLLLDTEARMVDGAPTHEAVTDVLPTLKARLENSRRAGKLIYGLEQAIANLDVASPSDVVVGYGFISPRAAGNFYLSTDGMHLLGWVIVDR